jgi:hypothetical protein
MTAQREAFRRNGRRAVTREWSAEIATNAGPNWGQNRFEWSNFERQSTGIGPHGGHCHPSDKSEHSLRRWRAGWCLSPPNAPDLTIFDGANLVIGALALAPSNPDILYVGTGEAGQCGSGCYAGIGVYRIDMPRRREPDWTDQPAAQLLMP